jgi:tetratricopeptide (TPR) repeat protein
MMVEEKHYDDDSLLTLASEPVALDEHLAACTDCSERLETYRLIAEAMADETTWDMRPLSDAPVPETIANLRGFADRMAMEDGEAAANLPNLLVGPREQWMANLHHHAEYRTAGMVRKLIEAVPAARNVMPRDAAELTALAIEIADNLETAMPQLRGAAWRERAYALFYIGDFVGAERALCASERHFTESVVNEYDLARVGVVRAVVERGLEKYTSAIGHARESALTFSVFADAKRTTAARLAEAPLLVHCHQYQRAYDVLLAAKNDLRPTDDDDTYARVLSNLGYCCFKLSRHTEALLHLDAAAQLFDALAIPTEATRARWNAARVLAAEGHVAAALSRLRQASSELATLGMGAAATEASLEVAELLLVGESFDEVEKICQSAIAHYDQSKLAYTAPALTALALLHEAVKNRTVTPNLVHHVREYLCRVPNEPTLLFAFPPE